MTAGPAENQAAGQAQAAGDAAAAGHQADALAQHAIAGSTQAAEPAATPDSHSVAWNPAGDDSAQPTLNPSQPPPVGQYENHGPPAA